MNSIRRSLSKLLLLILGVFIAFATLACWLWARHSLINQFDTTLRARAELIMATVEEDDGNLEMEFNFPPSSEIRRSDILLYRIATAKGATLIASENFPQQIVSKLSWKPGRQEQFQLFELENQQTWRAMQVHFDAGDDEQANFRDLTLLVARDARSIESALTNAAAVMIGVGVFSMLGLWVGVRHSLKVGLLPLHEFARKTGQIEVGSCYSPLVSEGMAEELVPMSEKLTELMDRVRSSLERERQFTRNVAHELRTPVAELKVIAEMATKWADQAGPEAFGEIMDIATEMEGLVASLTLLNKLDAGTVHLEIKPTALDAIVGQILARCTPAIQARNIDIACAIAPGEVIWQTDPVLWKIAATNLIENALTYAPPNSTVVVSLSKEEFSVANSAPDLSKEDLAKMRQAFWRKESPRAETLHSGLGLSLVDAIATALGANLKIEFLQESQLVVLLRHPQK